MESRNATIMTNDIIRVVIEDQGGMTLELSAATAQGDGERPPAPTTGVPALGVQRRERVVLAEQPVLYQKAGSHFSFPNFGPEFFDEFNQSEEHGGYTASSYWMVERYGTDPEFGGVWLLSSIRDKKRGGRPRRSTCCSLPPGHYSAIFITNTNETPLIANAVWNNEVGPPSSRRGVC